MEPPQNYHYQYSPQSPIPNHFPQPAAYTYYQQPRPPVYPVVIWTAFFGLFGVIAAALRAGRAAKGGHPQGPYWVAWAVTCFVGFLLWAVLIGAGGLGNIDADAVEQGITSNRMKWADGIPAKSAHCSPADVDQDGAGFYSCSVTKADGAHVTMNVWVDTDGNIESR